MVAHPTRVARIAQGPSVSGWFYQHMLEMFTLIINAKSTWHFMDTIPNMLTKLPYQHYTVMSSV